MLIWLQSNIPLSYLIIYIYLFIYFQGEKGESGIPGRDGGTAIKARLFNFISNSFLLRMVQKNINL